MSKQSQSCPISTLIENPVALESHFFFLDDTAVSQELVLEFTFQVAVIYGLLSKS